MQWIRRTQLQKQNENLEEAYGNDFAWKKCVMNIKIYVYQFFRRNIA